MTEGFAKGLLPAGVEDLLAPEASHEAEAVERLLACFASYGYERVKPPLVEFEENLLQGSGKALAKDIFRLMDPLSQRMMGVRADLTMQVARIAQTRLARAPRPLRLSYAGEVLRIRGSELQPTRALTQVGLELVGSAAVAGDAEVILLAAEALARLGIEGLSIDLNAPTLVPAVIAGLSLDDTVAARARAALDRKDAAAVAALGGRAAALLGALLQASGAAGPALEALAAVELPVPAQASAAELREVARRVCASRPDLQVSLDPVEHRGLEYHTGVSFSIFALGARGELGRGGRYRVGEGERTEPATGATLFMPAVLRRARAPERRPRLFLPAETAPSEAAQLRGEGWIALAGLAPCADARAEARRLGCSHVWLGGKVEPLGGKKGA